MEDRKRFPAIPGERELGSLVEEKITKSKRKPQRRILIGIPLTGLVRGEWAIARYSQVIPCNWSQSDALTWLDQFSPLEHSVADARNITATKCIENGFEWLFFIDHDVVLPPHTIITWNQRMLLEKVPVFCGLYFTKSVPSEPLIYRGRGNGYYTDWKMGDKVWVDGIPMGCTMIHSSILKVMWDDADWYNIGEGIRVKKIFETPARIVTDPETKTWYAATGTEDLEWCNTVIDNDVMRRAGWPEFDVEFPFLLDTGVFCRHIDFDGVQYPSRGEEQYFVSKTTEA